MDFFLYFVQKLGHMNQKKMAAKKNKNGILIPSRFMHIHNVENV